MSEMLQESFCIALSCLARSINDYRQDQVEQAEVNTNQHRQVHKPCQRESPNHGDGHIAPTVASDYGLEKCQGRHHHRTKGFLALRALVV